MTTWNDSAALDTIVRRVGTGGAVEINDVSDTGIDPTTLGDTGAIGVSEDDWYAEDSGVTVDLYGIAVGSVMVDDVVEVVWVAVGDDGTIITKSSSDSEYIWRTQTSGTSEHLYDVAYVGLSTGFIAVGANGTVLTSRTGETWTLVDLGVTVDLWGVTASTSDYYIVGNDETILVGSFLSVGLDIHLVESTSMSATPYDAATNNMTVTETTALDELTNEAEGFFEALGDGFSTWQSNLNYSASHSVTVANIVGMMEKAWDPCEVLLDTLEVDSSEVLPYLHFLATEGFTTTDTDPVANIQFNQTILDVIGAGDAPVASVSISMLIPETVGLDDPATANQAIQEALADSVGALAAVRFSGTSGGIGFFDESYTGVVLNVDNKANSEYQGFDFNSMCSFNGESYAARYDGIYRIGGDSDNGVNISSVLRFGITDFGMRTHKRVPEAYLGLRNDGGMVLKVNTRDREDGQLKQYWYEMAQSNEPLNQRRTKFGKGLKAVYWQFELVNQKGADFELDHITFYPVALTRRV